MLRNHPINDGIPEELQALIILVPVTSVGQGQQQPLGLLEGVSDTTL
jgi:hypothetical protein